MSSHASADQIEQDIVRDRNVACRIRFEPTPIEEEVRPTGELDRIDRCRQRVIEPESQCLEPSLDVGGLVEVDQAEGRALAPLSHGREQLDGSAGRRPHHGEGGPQLVEEADEGRSQRDRRDTARQIAEDRPSAVCKDEPGR